MSWELEEIKGVLVEHVEAYEKLDKFREGLKEWKENYDRITEKNEKSKMVFEVIEKFEKYVKLSDEVSRDKPLVQKKCEQMWRKLANVFWHVIEDIRKDEKTKKHIFDDLKKDGECKDLENKDFPLKFLEESSNELDRFLREQDVKAELVRGAANLVFRENAIFDDYLDEDGKKQYGDLIDKALEGAGLSRSVVFPPPEKELEEEPEKPVPESAKKAWSVLKKVGVGAVVVGALAGGTFLVYKFRQWWLQRKKKQEMNRVVNQLRKLQEKQLESEAYQKQEEELLKPYNLQDQEAILMQLEGTVAAFPRLRVT
jgi:hypothetical protein